MISTQEYQDIVRDSLTEFGQEGTGDADVAALTQHSAFIGEVGEDDPGELPGAIERRAASWPTLRGRTRPTSSSCTTWPSRRGRSSR